MRFSRLNLDSEFGGVRKGVFKAVSERGCEVVFLVGLRGGDVVRGELLLSRHEVLRGGGIGKHSDLVKTHSNFIVFC